jgi:hypothetical protein
MRERLCPTMTPQRRVSLVLFPRNLRPGDVVIVTDAALGDRSCAVLSAPVIFFGGKRVSVRIRRSDGSVGSAVWGAHETLRVRRARSRRPFPHPPSGRD